MIIPYGKQNIDRSDIKNVVKCLKSDFLTQGPIVQKFENSLKKNFKAKNATVVSNGSAALRLVFLLAISIIRCNSKFERII